MPTKYLVRSSLPRDPHRLIFPKNKFLDHNWFFNRVVTYWNCISKDIPHFKTIDQLRVFLDVLLTETFIEPPAQLT